MSTEIMNDKGQLNLGLGLVYTIVGIAIFFIIFQSGLVNTAELTATQLVLWLLIPTIALIVVVLNVLGAGGRR